MLHRLCGPPSIPLSFMLAHVLPRRRAYWVTCGTAGANPQHLAPIVYGWDYQGISSCLLPQLSSLSVSHRPGGRLRHWCSSRYLRISPLHREFRRPLRHSSLPVSHDLRRLSRRLSRRTRQAAYAPFTPSDSGQRSPPTCYRGCWHVVSRGFLGGYRQNFFPSDRGLRPKGLHPSRGVAASGFRPLRQIPYCCLPSESGPCLSASVAGHPLRPATLRRLGEPLPHQLANGTQGHPQPVSPLTDKPCDSSAASGISPSFPGLSRRWGQVPYALLTRPPLG